MNDLTLLREFRAERVEEDPQARAAAWRGLEARFEIAAPGAMATPAPRRALFPRRRLLAFAAVMALAATLAGVVVLDSGPTAQKAAARILHETAAVAAASDEPAELPQPGQFYYRKFTRLELQSWVPGGTVMGGGVLTRPGAFTALMPTTQESWTAPDGAGRVRELAGTPQFLSDAERRRWEAAGSRLPAPFDPEYQRKYRLAFGAALEAGRGVVDREVAALEGFRFPDTSDLPTEPEALRLAVESNQIPVRGFNPMYPGRSASAPTRRSPSSSTS
ncbi:MAG TPA: hypothetical protein VF030_10945 [Solirubrobacterales bacterium]